MSEGKHWVAIMVALIGAGGAIVAALVASRSATPVAEATPAAAASPSYPAPSVIPAHDPSANAHAAPSVAASAESLFGKVIPPPAPLPVTLKQSDIDEGLRGIDRGADPGSQSRHLA